MMLAIRVIRLALLPSMCCEAVLYEEVAGPGNPANLIACSHTPFLSYVAPRAGTTSALSPCWVYMSLSAAGRVHTSHRQYIL